MKLEKIGFYTLSDERAKKTSINSDLQRCELLITDRCNFKCDYCRGSNNYTKGTMSLKDIKNVIDLWSHDNLQNIRFSGGEPTLHPNIIEIIEYTKTKGIKRIAISTNGSNTKELYQKLVLAGVNDFSISLDACCSSKGDIMAGNIKGVFNKISDNIKLLSKLTYVSVGVVLTDNNFQELPKIIEFADSLGVSDIRIISSAQWNNEEKFKQLFQNKNILTKYPILQYRIDNFKNNKNVRGISLKDSKKCSLMLDDMVIANNNHFSCVIAMREGEMPIGNIKNKSIMEIRKERECFLKKLNTHNNKICKKNCLDVCVDYNNKVEFFEKKKEK